MKTSGSVPPRTASTTCPSTTPASTVCSPRWASTSRQKPATPGTGSCTTWPTGSADVALGGLWVPAMYAHRGRDFVAFAQLNDRFPMAIVTREPVEDFSWSWLAGRTLLVPGQGGTAPYEFTAGLMRRAGADPARTRFARDLSTPMLTELFVNGLGERDRRRPGHGVRARAGREGPRRGQPRRARRHHAQQRLLRAAGSGSRSSRRCSCPSPRPSRTPRCRSPLPRQTRTAP